MQLSFRVWGSGVVFWLWWRVLMYFCNCNGDDYASEHLRSMNSRKMWRASFMGGSLNEGPL